MSFTQRSRWGSGAQEGRGSESIRFHKNGLKDSCATPRFGRAQAEAHVLHDELV